MNIQIIGAGNARAVLGRCWTKAADLIRFGVLVEPCGPVRRRDPCERRRAFTLIESLVINAIIAVGLADMMPDWSNFKPARYLLEHSELLRQRDRTPEAQAAFDAAVAPQQRASNQDWPMWGGADPGRNMYSPARDLPITFDPGKFIPGTEEIDFSTTRKLK